MRHTAFRQTAQNRQNTGILRSQKAQRDSPAAVQRKLFALHEDAAVAAQTYGMDINAMYHRPPLTDLYAVTGLDRISVPYDGYIGGGAAHIHDQRTLFMRKMLSADHTGGRPAQQRFHRMLCGEPTGHHCAVAADDPDGDRNAKLL